MELVILAIAIVFMVLISMLATKRHSEPKSDSARTPYRYTRKDKVMTSGEITFFKRLEGLVADKYYIFPQIHLSSLLNHKVSHQNWKGALSKIQRKSVDFILADKQDLQTKYVVELDDSTHERLDRQKRDSLVSAALQTAGIPLVRFRSIDSLSDENIVQAFQEAHEQLQQHSINR